MIMPLFQEEKPQFDYSLIGLAVTGSNLLTLVTQVPSGYLADRYGRKRLTVACISLLPVVFGVWVLTENWPILLVLYTVANGLWSMTWPATPALLTDSVPPELIGTAFGIRMTGVRLGFTVGPMLAGSLYSSFGYSAPFL